MASVHLQRTRIPSRTQPSLPSSPSTSTSNLHHFSTHYLTQQLSKFQSDTHLHPSPCSSPPSSPPSLLLPPKSHRSSPASASLRTRFLTRSRTTPSTAPRLWLHAVLTSVLRLVFTSAGTRRLWTVLASTSLATLVTLVCGNLASTSPSISGSPGLTIP